MSEIRKEIEDKMEETHGTIWEDIKSKTPQKLFYLFITAYTGLFVAAIVTLYGELHSSVYSIQQSITDIRIAQTEMKITLDNTQAGLKELKDDLRIKR